MSEAAGDLSCLIAAARHLVFGYHLSVLDQRRPDRGFVLQGLAQEGVMRIT